MDRPLKSVTHGQCDARPTVTFPTAEHHRCFTGIKLYCLVTEAHGCEQLAHSCYPAMRRLGVKSATSRLQLQCHNHYITEPPALVVDDRILWDLFSTVVKLYQNYLLYYCAYGRLGPCHIFCVISKFYKTNFWVGSAVQQPLP